ncbi:MAG: hypothetical protein P4M11_02125, partial [Candidatus Pacebacteria bacterium]|nr:hypothetical protein [Candidatus Paceibacterota bacterium]
PKPQNPKTPKPHNLKNNSRMLQLRTRLSDIKADKARLKPRAKLCYLRRWSALRACSLVPIDFSAENSELA